MDFIMNFNQAKLLCLKATNVDKNGKTTVLTVDMNDILILNYIITALCSTAMKHLVFDNTQYVWINRTKLLTDLPILGITANRLTHIFDKLQKLGLLESKHLSTKGNKGSTCYFTATDLLISCMNDQCDMYFNLLGVKNNTSNNISISNINDIDNKDISEVLKITPNRSAKGQSLYDKCVSVINNYTEDEELIQLLIQYLAVRLKIKDKPITQTGWLTLIKKLDTFTDKKSVIQQSIDKQWASFFDIKSSNINTFKCNAGVQSVKMTDEQKAEYKLDIERRKADGKRVSF